MRSIRTFCLITCNCCSALNRAVPQSVNEERDVWLMHSVVAVAALNTIYISLDSNYTNDSLTVSCSSHVDMVLKNKLDQSNNGMPL